MSIHPMHNRTVINIKSIDISRQRQQSHTIMHTSTQRHVSQHRITHTPTYLPMNNPTTLGTANAAPKSHKMATLPTPNTYGRNTYANVVHDVTTMGVTCAADIAAMIGHFLVTRMGINTAGPPVPDNADRIPVTRPILTNSNAELPILAWISCT